VSCTVDISVEQLETDPYPVYEQLRRDTPVAYVEALDQWFVTRWADCLEVGRDEHRFSAATDWSPLEATIGPNMLDADGEEHARLRAVVEPHFTAGALRDRLESIVLGVADELIDHMVATGTSDVVAGYSKPLAAGVLQRVLGVADVSRERFEAWVDGIGVGASNFERDPGKHALGQAACADIDRVLEELLNGGPGRPNESVLSRLADAERAGLLSRPEVRSTFKLLIIGGIQEVRDLVGLTIWALLLHPEQLAAVQADPGLHRRAVEEVLRWQSPVGTVTREAVGAVVLGDVELPAGARLAAVIASANRDEARWTAPERFDLHRREGGHLAFAAGPHLCLGAWMGRQHAHLSVRRFFERLPDVRLDDSEQPVVRGYEFRGPVRMLVHWDDIR
jgi:cytochrome P450